MTVLAGRVKFYRVIAARYSVIAARTRIQGYCKECRAIGIWSQACRDRYRVAGVSRKVGILGNGAAAMQGWVHL